MGKTWVLNSETKGTGAHMAPLESAERKAGDDRALATVRLHRPPRSAVSAAPVKQRFKVVDVLSSRVLVEDAGAREAIEALEQLRSVLDARVSIWSMDAGRWKLLSLDEQKALWRFRRESRRV